MTKILITFILLYNFLPAKDVSLQLVWKHQFQFAGYYMAKYKGFYSDVGLNVKIDEYNDYSMNLFLDVLNKKHHFGVARSSLIIDKIKHNKEILLLAAIFQQSPIVLVSKIRDDIKSIKDIKNKTIMLYENSSEMAEINVMLKSNGINKNDYKTVIDDNILPNFINNKVDLISAYISNEPYTLYTKGISRNIFHPKDYGFDFYSDILFTSKSYKKQNPKTVKDFKEASLKGWHYAFNNINETVDFIYENYNTLNKTKQALLYEAKELKKLAYVKNIPLGNINEFKLQNIKNMYTMLKLIPNKENIINDMIYKDNKQDILTNEQQLYIKNNILKIGISSLEPIIYNDTKKDIIKGIFPDIINLLKNDYKLNIHYINKPWNELLFDFKNGDLDLLPGLHMHDIDIDKNLSLKEIFSLNNYIYIKKTNTNIKSFKDLKNKKLALLNNNINIKNIQEKYPNIKVILSTSIDDLVNKLLENKVDAIFTSQIIIDYYLKINSLENLKKIYQSDFKKRKISIITNTNNKELSNIIAKIVNNIDSIKIEKIIQKWSSYNKNITSISKRLNYEEYKYLKNKKIIRMCTNNNLVPIEFKDKNNNTVGISIDIINLLEQQYPIKFKQIYTKSIQESIKFLKEKKCDIISGITNKKNLKKFANFTNDYLSYKLAIITNTKTLVVNSINKLLKYNIAIHKSNKVLDEIIKKYANLKINNFKSVHESFLSIQNNTSMFSIENSAIASYNIYNHALYNLHIAAYTKEYQSFSIAINKENKILLNILNKGLDSISNKNKKNIHNKWIYKDTFDKKTNKNIFYYFIIVIIFLMILLLYKQYLVNKENINLHKKLKLKKSELLQIKKFNK